MKEVWTNNPEQIQQEIETLITEKTILHLYQPGGPTIKALVRKITENQGGKALLLAKKAALTAPNDSCLALYRLPSSPMHAFKSMPISETADQLDILFPEEIMQIQRRKYPRVTTSSNSSVTFTRMGSQHINRGIVKDVCLAGAKLHGNFSQFIQVNDYLSPVTLTLRLRYGNYEETVVVPEAMVCRVIDLPDNIKEVGIHFVLREAEAEGLERFIAMRSLEEKPRKKTVDG